MQKLKTEILQRMIRTGVSSLEIDFLLSIGRRQDNAGCVHGVYYKDIMDEIGCSAQHFYDILRSLDRKRIIKYQKASYYDYDITIIGNEFPEGEPIRCGYISLNKGMYGQDFRKLRAGEKLLAMELLRRQDIQFHMAQKPSLCYIPANFYDKFCSLLGVTKRVVRSYLKNLKDFFTIGEKAGYLYVTPLKRSYSVEMGAPTDQALYGEQEILTICRRNRIQPYDYGENAVRDTAALLTQYRSRALELGFDLLETLKGCIIRSIGKGYGLSARQRRLEPPLIHKLLQNYINGYHSFSNPEGIYQSIERNLSVF